MAPFPGTPLALPPALNPTSELLLLLFYLLGTVILKPEFFQAQPGTSENTDVPGPASTPCLALAW